MRDDETRTPDASDPGPPETPYEPPRADEVASEGQAATAAWIATGEDDDV